MEGRDIETTHGLGCFAVTGYQPNEFKDDAFLWINMVPEEERLSIEEQVRRILAGDDPPPIEHRILHKNGTIRWVRNTFVPHRNEHGVLVTYDGLIQDITERKKAEDSLRWSEEKFSKAFHASPDSININRLADGVYLAVNEGFTRITGYTAEEVLGHSSLPDDLGLWVNGEDRRRLQEGLNREGFVQGLEAPFRKKNGTGTNGPHVRDLDRGSGGTFAYYPSPVTSPNAFRQKRRKPSSRPSLCKHKHWRVWEPWLAGLPMI